MIVYWDRKRLVEVRKELALLPADSALDALIRLGEIEAGIADARWPERDGDDAQARQLRAAVVSGAGRYLGHATSSAANLDIDDLPARVETGIPEGYAYYALYPESYACAAREFVRACRPDRVGVIGIRSIGTSLSAVVAAELVHLGCHVETWTVRPHGHPFDRRLVLTGALERRWSEMQAWWWAVVDEGPGLSGSSITCVAATLSNCGIPDERIVLFPSWNPDGASFVSEAARARWPRHRKFVGESPAPDGLEEVSGGEWRKRVFPAPKDWPAVQPQHERRKLLAENGRVLWKFAGLGRFGAAKLERAQRIHEAGFCPRPLGLSDGYLRLEWLPGTPVRAARAGLIDGIARYSGFLAREFPADTGASPEALARMISVNAGFDLRPPTGSRACDLDGRMMPHEWVRTRDGLVKTDGLDHHDDHFLPGPQSIAWDVAGAAIEFGLPYEAIRRLASACHVGRELPFYAAAYAAFRLGYAALAQNAIPGTQDAARFAALAPRYRAACDHWAQQWAGITS